MNIAAIWLTVASVTSIAWAGPQSIAERPISSSSIVRALAHDRPVELSHAEIIGGLDPVKSTNPLDLRLNHPALAYGYDLVGDRLTLSVLDPNLPRRDDATLFVVGRRPDAPDCGHPGSGRTDVDRLLPVELPAEDAAGLATADSGSPTCHR
jgi:hypothetical protein